MWLKLEAWWEMACAAEKTYITCLSIKQITNQAIPLATSSSPKRDSPSPCFQGVWASLWLCFWMVTLYKLWTLFHSLNKAPRTQKHPAQTITLHRGLRRHPLPNLIWKGQQLLLYVSTSVSNPHCIILMCGSGYLRSVFHLELTVSLLF